MHTTGSTYVHVYPVNTHIHIVESEMTTGFDRMILELWELTYMYLVVLILVRLGMNMNR